jgi:hypothetical protein
MKMRVSLSEEAGEIKGIVSSTGTPLFILECLALIVETLAKDSGLPPDEVVRDLYSIVCGKIK